MLNGCFKSYIVSQYMDHTMLYVIGTSLDTMILQMRLDSHDTLIVGLGFVTTFSFHFNVGSFIQIVQNFGVTLQNKFERRD